MKASYILQQGQVMGLPITSSAERMAPRSLLFEDTAAYRYMPTPAYQSLMLKQSKIPILTALLKRMNKMGKKANKFAHGIREHVKLGNKISETLKGKLTLGVRILQVGGVKKVFRQFSCVSEGERLLKACQCYLSTTLGPIAGLLFISTHKLAFCSERSIQLSSPEGKSIRVHYKVVIPLEKIERANQSENTKKPSQKYMQVVTEDGFDLWFMSFLSYKKAFKYVEQAMSSCMMTTTAT